MSQHLGLRPACVGLGCPGPSLQLHCLLLLGLWFHMAHVSLVLSAAWILGQPVYGGRGGRYTRGGAWQQFSFVGGPLVLCVLASVLLRCLLLSFLYFGV